MNGVNKVFLMGALGADPELRFTQAGKAVLNMRVATSEKYKDNSGTYVEKTEWHHVVVWGAHAEALAKFLSKGSKVFVEGSLRTTSYEKSPGDKRYKTEINATNVTALSGKGEAPEPTEAPAKPNTYAPRPRAAAPVGGGFGGNMDAEPPGAFVEDLPF